MDDIFPPRVAPGPPPCPVAPPFVPGYHLRPIEKGVLGEPSKIKEECEEFLESCEQGIEIMALVELADLVGAIGAWLKKYHPTMRFGDLLAMSHATERAFTNGRRS